METAKPDDLLTLQNVLHREAKILEVMKNANRPMSAAELSTKCGFPLSTTYRSLKSLEEVAVIIITKESLPNDKGKLRLTKMYSIDAVRASNFAGLNPTISTQVPEFYNLLSKKLYSLLDFMGRYDPEQTEKTSGAKAADSYLEVATHLLALSFADPDSVEAKRQQLLLRQYLQQAQAVIKNLDSTMTQMLNDARLWSNELYVLSAIEQVKNSKTMIENRASRSPIGT